MSYKNKCRQIDVSPASCQPFVWNNFNWEWRLWEKLKYWREKPHGNQKTPDDIKIQQVDHSSGSAGQLNGERKMPNKCLPFVRVHCQLFGGIYVAHRLRFLCYCFVCFYSVSCAQCCLCFWLSILDFLCVTSRYWNLCFVE